MVTDLSIVITVFNEEEVLSEFYQELNRLVFEGVNDVEFLFIDDGSSDSTAGMLASLAEQDKRIRYILLSRNFGHQAAVSAGVMHARGKAVAVIDGDLQDPPSLLVDMVKKWQQGYQIVYAVRQKREGTSAFLKMAYRLYYRFQEFISDDPVNLDSGDFCLMDRKVVDIINRLPEKNRYMRGLRAWVGFKQIPLSYSRPARQKGITKYSLKKLFKLAFQGIMSTSVKPLYLSGGLSILSVLVCLGLVIYVFTAHWFSPTYLMPKGWSSLMITIAFFSFSQLISVWLLSLYVAKIYRGILSRPDYLIAYDSYTKEKEERKP